MLSTEASGGLPKDFIWRRLHSLTGLFLVLFLIEHLLTNSQAALLLGDDGAGFIRMVNFIHSLPYLPAIEIFLLGMPILIHAAWGVRYLITSKANSFPGNGARPSLTEYPRNHAYTFQRITSWILLLGIAAHVTQMRFVKYPSEAFFEGKHHYMVSLTMDDGLYTVADRLGVSLFDEAKIQERSQSVGISQQQASFSSEKAARLIRAQHEAQAEDFVEALQVHQISDDQVVASSTSIATVILLTVRDTMKSVEMALLYSIFVLAAVFHAFNGLWTFCIVWGITLSDRSQAGMRRVSTALMLGVAALGLSAIWGTYWLNLYQ